MPEPPRTERYEGLYPSQTQELFEADARDAAAHGWFPVSETWQGSTLFVVFVHDPERRWRTPVGAPAAGPAASAPRPQALTFAEQYGAAQQPSPSAGSGSDRRLLAVGGGVAVILVLAVTMFGLGLWDRPASLPPSRNLGPTAAPLVPGVSLGTRTDAVAFFQDRGYTGSLDTLADGRPRWLGRDVLGSIAEVIGPEHSLQQVDLTVVVGTDDDVSDQASDIYLMFQRYLPAALDWISGSDSAASAVADGKAHRRFGRLSAEVTGIGATDGALITYSIAEQ